MEIAQLALEDFSAGLARQRVEELDVLWNLEIGEAPAQKCLHRGGRQRRVRLRLDASAQSAVRAAIDFVADCARADRIKLRG